MRKDIIRKFSEKGRDHDNDTRVPKYDISEDAPKQEGMRKYHGFWGGRGYGGNYTFIHKMMLGCVGKKWGCVWSDICHALDVRKFQGQELRDYISRYLVHTKVDVIDGKVYSKSHRWRSRQELMNGDLYVHPETNILSVYKKARGVYPNKKPGIIEIDNKNYYCHEGIWYEVECAPINFSSRHQFMLISDVFGTFDDQPYSYWMAHNKATRIYGKYVRCISKRQLNKREIKKLRLRRS